MLKEVTMYTVVCDNCGADSNEGQEYSCWGEKSNAVDVAIDSGYQIIGDKHYCEDCLFYNDADELVIDKSRTKI